MTSLSQRRSWRCHNVVARLEMRVVPMSVSDIVTTSLSSVVKTLPQRCYNVTTAVTFSCNVSWNYKHASVSIKCSWMKTLEVQKTLWKSAEGKPTYLLASFIILMRVVYLWGKLEQNWIVVPWCEPFSSSVVHIHKYSSIQSHRYHLSTISAPILLGPYFHTPAVLFNTLQLGGGFMVGRNAS